MLALCIICRVLEPRWCRSPFHCIKRTSSAEDKHSPDSLMTGYRASLWFLFAMNMTSLVVGLVKLRKVRNVGNGKKS
ncbi:hypothetical protein PITC_060800 [Penicillium italicum]|uniref:Uncharacterized protein n=1 Tax=Penicillium italicum TaxID=40296 RepID=A0A0A2LD95_PENIT|nr:hypothetical protein PITC_060800 [Penicillium italicum]